MTIEILPKQLANQIAAGEVVERPASVVKELVENALDAGATKVTIDIEKGGSKLIRISDNGSGIVKEELALALARHGTSKISKISDLDDILSYGFRGEALASISSVSRLTLSSNTNSQAQGWQAFAQGRDMEVEITPCAQPLGTTVTIQDLFFNTPARRRFLKSEKTEFTHIEQWLKKFAVSKPHIQIQLSHNGKTVRNFKALATEDAWLERVKQVCGTRFVDRSVVLNCEHNGYRLRGCIELTHDNPSEFNYFFVNGRNVKDKLVSHALKQVLTDFRYKQLSGYVLHLELNPKDVDINVHPAKHEVRFVQARLVHDFIVQALSDVMRESQSPLQVDIETGELLSSSDLPSVADSSEHSTQWRQSIPDNSFASQGTSAQGQSGMRNNTGASTHFDRPYHDSPSAKVDGVKEYQQFIQTALKEPSIPAPKVGAAFHCLGGRFFPWAINDELYLIDSKKLRVELFTQKYLMQVEQNIVNSQPLLMPIRFKADLSHHEAISQYEETLAQLGFGLALFDGHVIIKQVPSQVKQMNLTELVPNLLSSLSGGQSASQWIKALKPAEMPAADVYEQFVKLEDDLQQTLLQGYTKIEWQQYLPQHTHL